MSKGRKKTQSGYKKAIDLLREADEFILLTKVTSGGKSGLDEPLDEEDQEIEDVTNKAFISTTAEGGVTMVEYLFERFPELPRMVIKMRGEEMKRRKIWVPEE